MKILPSAGLGTRVPARLLRTLFASLARLQLCGPLGSFFCSPAHLCIFKFLKMQLHPCAPQPSVSHTVDSREAQVELAGGYASGDCLPSQPAPSLLCAALQLTNQWECGRGKSPTVNQEAVAKIGEKQTLKRQWFLTALWRYPVHVKKVTWTNMVQAYVSSFFFCFSLVSIFPSNCAESHAIPKTFFF